MGSVCGASLRNTESAGTPEPETSRKARNTVVPDPNFKSTKHSSLDKTNRGLRLSAFGRLGHSTPAKLMKKMLFKSVVPEKNDEENKTKNESSYTNVERQGGISKDLSRELNKLFSILDKNGDGDIGLAEVELLLEATEPKFASLPRKQKTEKSKEYFAHFGSKDGFITLEQWRERAKEIFTEEDAHIENDEEWEESQEAAAEYTATVIVRIKYLQQRYGL